MNTRLTLLDSLCQRFCDVVNHPTTPGGVGQHERLLMPTPSTFIESPQIATLKHVTKRYKDVDALLGVSLTLPRGEVVGLLGPNGAGKTTLMRVMLGLVQPTSGSVSVLGGRPGSRSALARIGASIEGPAFVPVLSGRDNLRAAALAKGVGLAEVDRCLARVGLQSAARRPFKAYSMGMKQRLALAQAMLGDPELLIIDEPMNGLDPGGVVEMRALMAALAADGHTILVSSHQLREVEVICSRVIILNRGRIRASGTLEELGGDDLESAFFSILEHDDLVEESA